MPLIAGLRLLSLSDHRLVHDPNLSLWLFITLTQVQVMVSLITAAIPALKHALEDLSTQYGATAESNAGSRRYDTSLALRRLKPSHTRKAGSKEGHMLSMDASLRTVVGAGPHMPRNRAQVKNTGDIDGESQEAIVRQDEFEVSWDDCGESDRDIGPEIDRSRA